MILGIDPKVDYVFKRMFGVEENRDLLINLIHSIMQPRPEEQIAEVEFLNPFNEKESATDKLSILDIKARDQHGRQFNVEMQMLAHAFFRQRVLYYWAVLHQRQLQEGESYATLRPTVSVCFVNDELFPSIPDYHLVFRLINTRHGVSLTDDIVVHLVELPKFALSAEQLVTPLDKWAYFFVHGAELDTDVLPGSLNTPEFNRAMGVLEMFTKSELERDRYEMRLKAIRDDIARQETALQRGLAAGRTIGRIHTLQSLLGRPLTPEQALLTMPADELEQLAQTLESEFAK